MPRISEFYGIVIEMYFADHRPPHFHARYGGESAKIAITTGEVTVGSLPGRALRLVRKWLAPEVREIIHITEVEPLEGRRIRATFSDGAIKEIDLSEVFARGGVFTEIHERREVFERVRVNPESGTVEWPGEIDLDPEVLYGLFEPAAGVRIDRTTIRESVPATG